MNKLKSIKLSAVLIWLFILWFSFLAVQPIQAMPHGVKSAIPLRAVIAPDVFTDDNTTNGNCTLREAIIAANTNLAVDACPAGNVGGDTITLSAGTYNLTLTGAGEDVAATGDLDILEDLTITGVSSATTIIDAALGDRVFHIRAFSGTVHFENVQIVNGQTNAGSAHGAGIFLDQGALTVSDSRIANNQTVGAGSGGGGIFGGGGAIVLTNTEILSNSATALGGGIQVAFAPLVGSNIRVENNTAVDGGGGINADNLTLNSSAVINNRVTGGSGGGGGINAGKVTITDTIVVSNTTGNNGNGGGLAIALDSSTIVGGQIFGNTADGDGGGIYVAGGSSVTINGPQIYTNTANSQGGGMYISGQVQMLSGQIDDNQAQNGGGLWVNSGAVFTHTGGTIAYNSAPSFPGGGLWVGGTVLINGGQVLSNTSGNSGGGFIIGSGGVVELVSGQIDYNQANGAGGGLWVGNGAVFTQTGGTVAYNSAGSNGGGLWVEGDAWLNGGQVIGNDANNSAGLYISSNGAVTINGGEVVSNTATFYGGGATLANATSYLTMTSGLMAYNSAGTDGGGIYMSDGNLSVSNSRILTNSATTNGGVIYQFNGTTQINNSCIVDNSDTAVAYVAGTSPMDTTGNWWGTADGPSGVATGSGDSVDANVDFSGFLAAPILGCPTKQIFADLAISKNVNPASAAPGETITYTIAFTNIGPSIATNMVITDSFPVSVTIPTVVSSGLAITQTSGYPTYSWQVADMSPGQSGVITLTGQIETTATAGLMDNVVEITATGDITPNNNTATATLTISAGPCYATHDDGATVFNSADAAAVQDAVDDAPSGGTVKVAGYCAGVQLRAGVMQTVYITQNLTLSGGYTTTDWLTFDSTITPTLDALATGRVIYVTGAVNVQLDNLRVTNGRTTGTADHGAGIYSNGGTLTLNRLDVYSNVTAGGGGVDAGGIFSNQTLTINNSSIHDNTGFDRGGGLYVTADLHTSNSQFYSNSAIQGGAMYVTARSYITSSSIMSNTATTDRGGGLRTTNSVYLTDSTVSNNSSGSGGGAMFVSPGELYLTNSTVANNTASGIGGGLWIQNDAYLTNSVLENNNATILAGGMYINTGTAYITGTTVISNVSNDTGGGLRINRSAYITNSQILYNTANTQGGGLYINGAGSNNDQIQLVNSLLAGNVATNEGQAIYLQHTNGDDTTTIRHTTIANPVLGGGQALYLNDGTLNINNSIIANYTTGIEQVGGTANEDYNLFFGNGSNTIGTINSGGNSLTGDPLFVNPVGNDYHLSIGSAAIDAGIDLGVTTDFEGDMRPYLSSLPDIGYDESPYVTDVAINKTVTPITAAPGDTITYTIAFTNNGSSIVSNVMITDTLPVSLTVTSIVSSGVSITQTSFVNPLAWDVADMLLNETGRLTVTAQVTGTGSLGNVVEITGTGDITLTNNTSAVTVTVAPGDCYATRDDGGTVFNRADASAVQVAVDAAAAGDTVKVAGYCAGVQLRAGTNQTVYIDKNLTLRGGYTTTDWVTADITANPTTLDAQSGGRVVYVAAGSNLTIADITLTDGSDLSGGGLYFEGGGSGETLTILTGTVIINNVATNGGGMMVSEGSAFLNGGQIVSNTATSDGGGVMLGASSLEQNGGEIYGNQADNRGGGIFIVSDGYFVMNNGQIYDNQAVDGGGVHANGTFDIMTNGQIYNNTATNAGGGVYLDNRDLTFDNGQIMSNTAGLGGGIYFTGLTDNFTQNGGSIAYNQAITDGGGIYSENTGSVQLIGGQISYNTTLGDGGGVYLANAATLIQSGGTINDNVAQTNGGGIYVADGIVTFQGGQIFNNTAQDGGGIYVDIGPVSMTGGVIDSNIANLNGGAVYLNTVVAILSQTGAVTMSNNIASQYGGAIYFEEGAAILNGARILTNTGLTSGGAFYLTPGNGILTVNNSCIVGNSDTAVESLMLPPVPPADAQTNWWGAANGPSGVGPGKGDSVNANVDYTGFLAAPIFGCPETPLIADVAINKTVNPTTAFPGETITYTIAYTNNGPDPATNVVITDIIPAGVVIPLSIAPSGPPITPISGPTYAWTVDPLSVGQSGSIIMTGQVATSAPAGTIINTAEITATGDITPNNSSSANLTVVGFTPTLVVNNVTGSEADGVLSFTVELTAAGFTTVTVDYITQDQTATAGADYQGSSGTLSWPPGTLTNTVGVILLDDTLDEITETFSLLLSNPTNAQFATTTANAPITSATGTILDDDFYPDITLSDASGLENSDWLTFTVNLNAATNLTVTVSYATQDDTATAGLDYLSVSGSLIIPPGELSQPLTVTLVDDLLAEDNETFTLTLTAASNAYIVDGTGLGTIIDNETGVDLRLTKTVTPTTVLPGDWLTYTLTFSNAGPAIAQQVVITDLLPAQLTGVNYQAAGVTVTPTAGLTHVWTVADLAANTGGSLTINGQVQPTITATTLNNTAVIDSQTTEQDATNNQASASVAIGNLPQLSFEPATYQVDEAAGRVTVTVQLDGSPATTGASVGYTTQDGTALAGLDYLTATGRLTFTAGLTQQQFTVPISDDAFVELEETVQLSLFDPRGAALNLSTAILSIIDNDTAGIQLRPLSLTVTEAGASDRYNLRLTSAPQSPVTITIQATNGQVDPLPGKIFFTRNNWQISQTVIISAVDDLAVEGLHNDSLTHLVSSDDPAYAGLTVSPVEVVIRDNDFPAVSFSQAAYLVAEGAGSAQITVQLSDSPWLTATVDYQTTPGSATPDQDYRPVSGTLRFLPGTTALQWVIPISDDTLIESPETVNLSLLNPVNSSLTTPLTAVLTISDTDQLPPLAVTIQDSAPISTGSGLTLTVTPSDNTTPLSYRWQFGDGTPQVTTSQLHVNHAYLSPGVYTVILTATDGSRVANDTTTVIVDDPIQGLTATHTAPTLSNNPISFTASITQGTNVAGEISYSWDFGDGTTGIGPQPTHSYTSPGTYQVTVKATNSLGTVTTSITLVVGDGGSGTTDDLLEVRHFVSASQVTAGEFMTYQTIVLNVSQQAATSVVILHDWPADDDGQPAFYGFVNEGTARELSVAQVSGSQTAKSCTLQGAQLRCQIEELPAGSRVTINLMLSPRLSGTLVSRVTATATETDLTPANNLVEVTTEVLPETPARPSETVVTAANRPSRVYLPVVVKP